MKIIVKRNIEQFFHRNIYCRQYIKVAIIQNSVYQVRCSNLLLPCSCLLSSYPKKKKKKNNNTRII